MHYNFLKDKDGFTNTLAKIVEEPHSYLIEEHFRKKEWPERDKSVTAKFEEYSFSQKERERERLKMKWKCEEQNFKAS